MGWVEGGREIGRPFSSDRESDLADPLAIIPNGFQRHEVTGVEHILSGFNKVALLEILVGIAGVDRDMLQDAGIAVAIDHATRAAVADDLGLVELIDAAHWGFPEMAPVEVEVPVEVEILMAPEASEFFGFALEMALHIGERLGRVDYGEPAALFHGLDLLEDPNQFVRGIIH